MASGGARRGRAGGGPGGLGRRATHTAGADSCLFTLLFIVERSAIPCVRRARLVRAHVSDVASYLGMSPERGP